MQLNISEFFVYLLQRKSFYGRMAAALNRVCKPGLGTMAVGVHKGRVTLFYDPEFVGKIGFGAAMFVLEHEILHLALDHIPRYLELLGHCADDKEKTKGRAVFNIAADCAINSLLRDHKHFNDAEEFTKQLVADKLEAGEKIPEGAGMCLPEKYDLPDRLSFEAYQFMLMQRVNVTEVTISMHDLWEGELDPNATSDALAGEAQRLREQLKQALRNTMKSIGGNGRGLLPAGVEEFLSEYLADPIIPWWEVFATRAKTSKTSKFRRSVTVPNRALLALSEEDDGIIPAPGRIRDKSWRVFLMVDTSGSMSTESLEIVKSELQHMLRADEGMELRYMHGDADVHFDVLLKPGDEIPAAVYGRGGTCFDSYFKYMGKYAVDDSARPDIVVVYTDGYAPAINPDNRLPEDIPVIWLVTPQHAKEMAQGYGEIIVCDPSHNGLYEK